MQLSKGISLQYQALVAARGGGDPHERIVRDERSIVVKRVPYWVTNETSDGRDCDTTYAPRCHILAL